MTDLNRPPLGEPNAPCRTCGAPLAADQRYCLQCGTRRAEARLPFLEIIREKPAAPAPVAPPDSRSWFGRVSTNAAAVAGVACLLLALGVGVLLGSVASDNASGSSDKTEVITVGGAAVAPAAVAPTASSAAPATTTETTPAKSSKKEKARSSSSSSSGDSSKASSDVKDLSKSSGDDYSKKSAKLPKSVDTGGKLPPKDKSGSKIGDGSDVEEIG